MWDGLIDLAGCAPALRKELPELREAALPESREAALLELRRLIKETKANGLT